MFIQQKEIWNFGTVNSIVRVDPALGGWHKLVCDSDRLNEEDDIYFGDSSI